MSVDMQAKDRRPMRGRRSPDGGRHIVYVLGSTRSGTSALRNAINQTRYKGFGEGHMEPMLTRLVELVQQYADDAPADEGNAWYRLDASLMIRHFFRGYEAYLSERLRSDYLLDKTPTARMVLAVPGFAEFHSRAKFIHCSRRHVDNVQSKRKKFPQQGFHQSCVEWARCNRNWLEVRDKLGGNCLEFDFFDLVTKPEETAASIADYLDLDAAEADAMGAYLLSQRPQAEPGRDLTRFLKLSELDWTEEEKELFRKICGPVGQQLGYGFESYFEDEAGKVPAPPEEGGAEG